MITKLLNNGAANAEKFKKGEVQQTVAAHCLVGRLLPIHLAIASGNGNMIFFKIEAKL
jgi:hypothetical protein